MTGQEGPPGGEHGQRQGRLATVVLSPAQENTGQKEAMKTFQLVLLFCLLSQYVIAVGNAEYLILPSEVHPSTPELFHL